MDWAKEALISLGKLRDHALRKLPLMLDREEKLFCYRSTSGVNGWKNEGTSIRYSAIVLLGLLEARRKGYETPVDMQGVLDQLCRRYREPCNLGDLSIVLWAFARANTAGVDLSCKFEEVLSFTLTFLKKEGARRQRSVDSMEHSWALLALLECVSTGIKLDDGDGILENIYRDLLLNFYKETSLFSFSRVETRGKASHRKRLSFFAEQIYGILALSTYYEVTGDDAALAAAEACADKLVDMQTPKGAWPWRYDSARGTLAEIYPVFTVHQDGMAPMALAKLSSLSRKSYLTSAFKGILWLDGKNEIGSFLYDETQDIVWRGIRRRRPFGLISQVNKVMSLANISSGYVLNRMAPFFEIIKEVRSYHLGWILCAWAGVDDLDEKYFTDTHQNAGHDDKKP